MNLNGALVLNPDTGNYTTLRVHVGDVTLGLLHLSDMSQEARSLLIRRADAALLSEHDDGADSSERRALEDEYDNHVTP